MRIRKHAARILSSLSIPTKPCVTVAAAAAAAAAVGGREVEMHVCELNQSPWDAMAFTPPGYEPLYPYQVPQEAEAAVAEDGFVGGATGSEQRDEERADAVSDISGIYATPPTLGRQVKIEETAGGAEVVEKRERKVEARKRSSSHNAKKIKRKNTSSCTMGRAEEGKAKREVESAAAATAVPSSTCKKSDGKGWHCKREAQHPHSLCEYHLTQVRSYYSNNSSTPHLLQQQQQHPLRKIHGGGIDAKQNGAFLQDKKKVKKKDSCSNGHKCSVINNNVDAAGRARWKPASDFYYYYSGFGPWRGKRRSGSGGEREESNVGVSDGDDEGDGARDGAPPGPMVHDQAPDDLDDDDEDTDDGDDVGEHDGDDVVANKRRGRKPIKARSLKSLL